MNERDTKIFELAKKHDAFSLTQVVNAVNSIEKYQGKIPDEDLDVWMYCFKTFQPCLFKSNVVCGVTCYETNYDDGQVRKYMKKLMCDESRQADNAPLD